MTSNTSASKLPGNVWRIALTGGIASGKSLVGEHLITRQFPVIDADAVVHQLLREDAVLKRDILNTFGAAMADADGNIDRKKLGARVFNDATKRRQLELWIHPAVRRKTEQFFFEHREEKVAFSLIPLLFESGLADRYDEVWLLETPPELQIERLQAARSLTKTEAEARIRSQMTLAQKRTHLARHPHGKVLPNISTPEALIIAVDKLLARWE